MYGKESQFIMATSFETNKITKNERWDRLQVSPRMMNLHFREKNQWLLSSQVWRYACDLVWALVGLNAPYIFSQIMNFNHNICLLL